MNRFSYYALSAVLCFTPGLGILAASNKTDIVLDSAAAEGL